MAEKERFYTVAVETMLDNGGYTFDIPKKIVVKKLGRVYVHKSIFADILKREGAHIPSKGKPKGKYAHLFNSTSKDAPPSETVEVVSIYSGVWTVVYRGDTYTTTRDSLTHDGEAWRLNPSGHRLSKVVK